MYCLVPCVFYYNGLLWGGIRNDLHSSQSLPCTLRGMTDVPDYRASPRKYIDARSHIIWRQISELYVCADTGDDRYGNTAILAAGCDSAPSKRNKSFAIFHFFLYLTLAILKGSYFFGLFLGLLIGCLFMSEVRTASPHKSQCEQKRRLMQHTD